MTRIFEVKTICPPKGKDELDVHSTYRVAALDAEKAIAKAKRHANWATGWEKVISVNLLASTD